MMRFRMLSLLLLACLVLLIILLLRQAALTHRQETARLKQEARDVSSKYIAPPATTDFAILFLPIEGLYAEIVNRGMVERL